ncbi:hypothetical protein SDC9_51151 [bioreactor metagenome]|uniref:Uncharacterized protein n=1 Tax=bioreactor metagenome TaxID=1076179 RepID=A0A644WM55_9ZZZZ
MLGGECNERRDALLVHLRGHLFVDQLDDLLLTIDAVVVVAGAAVNAGMAVAGVNERLRAVQVRHARFGADRVGVFHDVRLDFMIARDAVVDEVDLRLVEVNVDSADLVDQGRKTIKTDADVFLNIEIEVFIEGVDQFPGAAAAVTAAVCAVQAVIKGEPAALADAVHAGIAHERNQGNRALLFVEGSEHHGVGTALGAFQLAFAARIRANEQDVDDAVLFAVCRVDGHRRGRRGGVVRDDGNDFGRLGNGDVLGGFFNRFHRAGTHAPEHVPNQTRAGQYDHQQGDQYNFHDFGHIRYLSKPMVKIAVKRDHDTITGGLFQFDFAECRKTHNFFTTGAIMEYSVFAGFSRTS